MLCVETSKVPFTLVGLKYELNENTNTNKHSTITTMFVFQPLMLRRVKWSSYFRLSEIRTQ